MPRRRQLHGRTKPFAMGDLFFGLLILWASCAAAIAFFRLSFTSNSRRSELLGMCLGKA